MARTSFFRIPEGISNPVVLIEGTSARIIDRGEALRLTDDKFPQAVWLNSREIRSDRGRLVVERCRRISTAGRGLSLVMSPAIPANNRGGDFRRSRYHKLLDDLASDKPSAAEFLEEFRRLGAAQNLERCSK